MADARQLAKWMHDSRMFSAYGTPQAVLSTMLLGRELGMPAMASLRSIHVIEGQAQPERGQLMVALVLKSGLAKYFQTRRVHPNELHLRDAPEGQPCSLRSHTYTIEQTRSRPDCSAMTTGRRCQSRCSGRAASQSWDGSNILTYSPASTRRRSCASAHESLPLEKLTSRLATSVKLQADVVRRSVRLSTRSARRARRATIRARCRRLGYPTWLRVRNCRRRSHMVRKAWIQKTRATLDRSAAARSAR